MTLPCTFNTIQFSFMNVVTAFAGDPEKSVSEIESVECYPMVSYHYIIVFLLCFLSFNVIAKGSNKVFEH